MSRHPNLTKAVVVVVALMFAAAGCSSSDQSSATPATGSTHAEPPPTTVATPAYQPPEVVVPAADVDRIAKLAANYKSEMYESWPDISAATDRWADDIVSYDPLNDEWVLQGAAVLVPLWRDTFAPYFPDVQWTVDNTYLSVDGVAYQAWSNLWPPWVEAPSDPKTSEVDQITFDGEEVASMSLWFADETALAIGAGCFEDAACEAEMQSIVETYIDTWTSGSPDRIATLYAPNAVLVDSMLGIYATGPDEISQQAATRFGQGDSTVAATSAYVQTNGFHPPTEDSSESGLIFGVAIGYRTSDPTGTEVMNSITFIALGTLEPDEKTGRAVLHPEGLITHEEVFHAQDTLARLAK
jgi:hypothetical protein